MFAASGASHRQLECDLEEMVAYAPEHVSTYELTVEAGTRQEIEFILAE